MDEHIDRGKFDTYDPRGNLVIKNDNNRMTAGTCEPDDLARDSGYKSSSSPEVKSPSPEVKSPSPEVKSSGPEFERIPETDFNPLTYNENGGVSSDTLLGNGSLPVSGSRSRIHSGIESSTESYNERMLRSGVWPLAEGSGEVVFSKPNSVEITVESNSNRRISSLVRNLTNSDLSSEKDDKDDDTKSENEVPEFSIRKLSREQLVVITATSFTNLLSFLSLSVLAPFFPLEAEHKGVNSTISGWIFGVFALVQFLTSPFFGRLMPIVGSKFMYVSGLFVCGGCTLLFGILDKIDTTDDSEIFIILCFATRILLALGCTALSNAGFVLLVKYFPDHVATVFGIGEIFTGVGMVTGPALGGLLYTAGGFILPFAVIGGCCFVSLPLIAYFIPKQDDSSDADEGSLSLRKVLTHPRSIMNSLVVIVAASVWSVLDPTLEPHLRVYGLGPEMIGLLFLIMAAFYSVTSPIWGRIADKLPDNRTLLVPGLLICAVGLLLAGPSPLLGFELSFNELWLTIVSLIILGVGSSMSVIPTYDIYIDVLGALDYPEDTRTYGMVSGIWVSMYALGDFIGPSLGGFLFEEIGFEWLVTWIGAVCVLTAILVCITWFIEVKCCIPQNDQIKIITTETTEKTPLLGDNSTKLGDNSTKC